MLITGMFNIGLDIGLGMVTAKDEYSQITYRGMNGSPFMKAFEAMSSFAYTIPADKIEYK